MAQLPLTRTQVESLARAAAPIALGRFPSDASREELVRIGVAVALQESSWRPWVKGGGGSIGLMQVRPATQSDIERWLGKHGSGFDPLWSMTLGLTYLAYQRKRYGSWAKAIYAYNAGSYPGVPKSRAWATEYTEQVTKKISTLWGTTPLETKSGSEDSILLPLALVGAIGLATWWAVRS